MAQEGHIVRWDAMIGQIGVVSHHLRSLLGAIKFLVLCSGSVEVVWEIASMAKRERQNIKMFHPIDKDER